MRNNVFLIGRLTKDIENRTTENGTSVAAFTLAVQRDFKNANGEYDTDFINCVSYRQLADMLSKYAHKGNLIGVQGRLQVRTYEKDGNTVYRTEVIIEKATLLTPKSANETQTATQTEQSNTSVEQDEIIITDDDLPF